MTLLGLLLGTLMGVSLGLLGGGGSILAVPILTYAVGFGAKEAIASSLAVVGLTSLAGVAGHWRSGTVNLRVGLVFGAVAMAGTYLGARLAVFFSGSAQLLLFAAVMLVVAIFMFRENGSVSAKEHASSGEGMAYGLIVLEGLAVGVLGRPDLLDEAVGGKDTRFVGARQMFASLRDRFLALPDYVQVWPGHGAGSACGKALGAVPRSGATSPES